MNLWMVKVLNPPIHFLIYLYSSWLHLKRLTPSCPLLTLHINPNIRSHSVERHWPLAAALLSPACPEGGAPCHRETADWRTAAHSGWPDAGRTSPPAARTAEIFLSWARLMRHTVQISHLHWRVVKETKGRVSWRWHAGKSRGDGNDGCVRACVPVCERETERAREREEIGFIHCLVVLGHFWRPANEGGDLDESSLASFYSLN